MKKKRNHIALLRLTKESPKARKQRLANGPQYRPAVFESRKKRLAEREALRELKNW